MFQRLKGTQNTTVSNRTLKSEHTHSRRKEKEGEDEEGDGFSQRGSKVAETNLKQFPHQSGLSLHDFLINLLNPKALLLIQCSFTI